VFRALFFIRGAQRPASGRSGIRGSGPASVMRQGIAAVCRGKSKNDAISNWKKLKDRVKYNKNIGTSAYFSQERVDGSER